MTKEEALDQIQRAGLVAKVSSGPRTILLGGQGYEPPSAPAHIGVFTGAGFHVEATEGGFVVRWVAGPQLVTEQNVTSLEEAVRLIIENIQPIKKP